MDGCVRPLEATHWLRKWLEAQLSFQPLPPHFMDPLGSGGTWRGTRSKGSRFFMETGAELVPELQASPPPAEVQHLFLPTLCSQERCPLTL